MRTSLPATLGALLVIWGAATGVSRSQAQSPEARAVLGSLQEFLTALRNKDSAGLVSRVDSLARFALLRPAPEGLRVLNMSRSQFVQAVTAPGAPQLDEPIRNAQISMDGNLAAVWAEYQVVINGSVSHCGFDAFHLIKRAEGWRILNVADTFRRTECGPVWGAPSD